LAFRRLLLSADRFNDAAIRLGSRDVNTPLSRVSASLCSVTRADQRRLPPRAVFEARRELPRPLGLRFRFLDALDFLAMVSPEQAHRSQRLGAFGVPAPSTCSGGTRR
jgi:hypothetical protein